MMRRLLAHPRCRVLATLVACLVLASTAAVAQTDVRRFSGAMDVTVPERTDAGSFDGTWVYVNRDARVVLWIETVDGGPRVKLRYFGTSNPEGFVTDWDGHAAYEVPLGRGEFHLDLTRRDEDLLEGTWAWQLDLGGSGREERAHVTLYRADDGRHLVMHFQDFEHIRHHGTSTQTAAAQKVWNFRKASRRLVRWEELPF